MTEEAEKTGLREVGNPPMHSDDRPVNRGGEMPGDVQTEDPGLGPRGEAAQHEPEYTEIQGSSRGGGNVTNYVPHESPQPADQ
ncbi:MAG TPA: hypothetical protein VHJ78_10020 [Actinomycetota bacterium]|nr:hypothetical protein [Actinomycetota bacterium]